MSGQVFEQYVDEFGNISVRVSQDIVVLTREDADRVKARLDQLHAENDRLRELAEKAWKAAEMLCQAFEGPCRDDGTTIYKPCPLGERDELCVYGWIQRDLRELGVEVDDGD